MAIKKQMTSLDHYQCQGITSGLKILAFLGSKINKKCKGRFLTLNDQLASRVPITGPTQLKAELTTIDNLRQDITHQGQPISTESMYSILRRAISKLLLIPTLNMPLMHPVLQCEREHGMNGERLLECLWEVDYELRHNSMYKDIMAVKETAPKPVGGVGPRSKRPPRGHSQQ